MNWFGALRGVVWLKRISRALDRIADAQEVLARIAESDWEKKNVRPKGKPVEIGTMDIAEVEKRVAREREERMEEVV